jgi:hypothetical protein
MVAKGRFHAGRLHASMAQRRYATIIDRRYSRRRLKTAFRRLWGTKMFLPRGTTWNVAGRASFDL